MDKSEIKDALNFVESDPDFQIIANSEIDLQNEEKKKTAEELVTAYKELAFLIVEREKRAEELIIANQELAFQNKEKEKRAEELIIANQELMFQNEEKEKCAKDLIIANQELIFQNEEKGKRAAELILANQELAFQNKEKENRAEELVIANRELIFQNEEKEKRAAELILINNELRKAEQHITELNVSLERKVMERTAELEAANKGLEAFSYSISHDLRAPLRSINGYAKMLEEDYDDLIDVDGKRMLGVVRGNAILMGKLIDDLLSFSRIGRKEMHKSEINMMVLVESVVDEIRTANPHVVIIFNNLPDAWGDRIFLRQVLYNYISNAVKFSAKIERPLIEIKSKLVKEEVIYSVTDNGTGFDMNYAHKLFKVFQRLHTQEEFEGTGVGLAIVDSIVSKHGGKVWAASEVGKGATFYFSLPIRADLVL